MRTRTGGLVAIAVLIGALAAVPAPQAAAQPDPAVSAAQVETTYVNLTRQPTFRLTVMVPAVFTFALGEANGVKILRVIGEVRSDLLHARMTRATEYLDRHESIFTALIDQPPNRDRGLRDLRPARRLSYNRRLTQT